MFVNKNSAFRNPIYTMTVLSENTFTTGDDEGVVKCKYAYAIPDL